MSSAVAAMLAEAGFTVTHTAMVPDEQPQISAELRRCADELGIALIVTTGGTGLSPRDVTPEATLAVLDREIRAIPVAMWVESLKYHAPRHAVPRRGGHAGPQPDPEPPRLGEGGAGEPVRRRRRAGARHAHDRRRGPWINKQKPDASASGFLSFLPRHHRAHCSLRLGLFKLLRHILQ